MLTTAPNPPPNQQQLEKKQQKHLVPSITQTLPNAELLIKKEFLKPKPVVVNDESSVNGEATGVKRQAEEDTRSSNNNSRKRGGGGNNKSKTRKHIIPTDNVCQNIVESGKCSFGEKCKYSHDIVEFLKNKGPDIGESCNAFELTGFCRFGIKCRYASKHLSEDGTKSIVNEEKYAEFLASGPPACKNVLDNGRLKEIRESCRVSGKTEEFMMIVVSWGKRGRG